VEHAEADGEAGAIARYGPALGIPRAYSGHNAFWRFGRPRERAPPIVVIGYRDPARLRGTFSGCKRSATIDNGVDLDNEEQGAPGDRRLVGEALAAAALAQPPDARTSGDASTRDANAEAHLRNVDGSGTAEAGA
jgi:hypothetical protein